VAGETSVSMDMQLLLRWSASVSSLAVEVLTNSMAVLAREKEIQERQ
jgi:hypothetical protein